MNLRVGSLVDMLTHADAPIWVKIAGAELPVRAVRRGNTNAEGPDIVLYGDKGRVLVEFEDQRVKLDLVRQELLATDYSGTATVVVFGHCASA